MPGDVSSRFSRKVTTVSFILAVFVMYIHAFKLVSGYFTAPNSLPCVLYKLFAGTFGAVGVPFFFVQSGYWMFRFDIFEKNSDILKRKMKNKVHAVYA